MLLIGLLWPGPSCPAAECLFTLWSSEAELGAGDSCEGESEMAQIWGRLQLGLTWPGLGRPDKQKSTSSGLAVERRGGGGGHGSCITSQFPPDKLRQELTVLTLRTEKGIKKTANWRSPLGRKYIVHDRPFSYWLQVVCPENTLNCLWTDWSSSRFSFLRPRFPKTWMANWLTTLSPPSCWEIFGI